MSEKRYNVTDYSKENVPEVLCDGNPMDESDIADRAGYFGKSLRVGMEHNPIDMNVAEIYGPLRFKIGGAE